MRRRVQELSRLFKFEFRFRADRPFDRIFDETVQAMIAAGELALDGERLAPGPGHSGWSGRDWLENYALLLAPFVEGYLVTLRALRFLSKAPLAEKDFVKRALAQGQEMFLAGEVARQEAVSKPLVQNALSAFVDHGYVVHRQNYYLGEGYTNPEALAGVEQDLRRYLPRSAP